MIRVIREIRVLLNIEILIFFRLNIYKGACMSTTIHQTMSYLYLPDSNNFLSFTGRHYVLLHPLTAKAVPSPYKQGESAIRTEVVRCTLSVNELV